MATDKTTSTTAKTPKPSTAAPKPEAQPKSPELLKVAYAKTGDNASFADVVIFGTNDQRSEFLRTHADTWWRIADLAKGQTLAEAIAGASNG